MNQLPQATRRRLSGDAEKVRGALELWDYQNRLMECVLFFFIVGNWARIDDVAPASHRAQPPVKPNPFYQFRSKYTSPPVIFLLHHHLPPTKENEISSGYFSEQKCRTLTSYWLSFLGSSGISKREKLTWVKERVGWGRLTKSLL